MPYGANSNEITGAVRDSREWNVTSNEVSLFNSAKIGTTNARCSKIEKQKGEGFAAERVRRQEDFVSMKKEMKDEMGEGFKNERMARGQSQKEMRSDIRSEIRSEMDIMREELEYFKRGSGSTVRSEVSTAAVSGGSSTFAQPPPSIATRYESHFWPRRMEFKGWIEAYDQCSLQGITMDEIRKFIVDLQKMIP